MKVILTAFGGKLRSEPMDWPEEASGYEIRMYLDLDTIGGFNIVKGVVEPGIPERRIGRFQMTGYSYLTSDSGVYAKEYRLVGI